MVKYQHLYHFLVGGGIQWSKKVTIWMCNRLILLFLDKRIIKLIKKNPKQDHNHNFTEFLRGAPYQHTPGVFDNKKARYK